MEQLGAGGGAAMKLQVAGYGAAMERSSMPPPCSDAPLPRLVPVLQRCACEWLSAASLAALGGSPLQ